MAFIGKWGPIRDRRLTWGTLTARGRKEKDTRIRFTKIRKKHRSKHQVNRREKATSAGSYTRKTFLTTRDGVADALI